MAVSTGEAPTLGDALRRHWLLVALCIVIGAAVGVAAALARTPVWSTSAGMIVGQNNLSVQSIPGFAVGGQAVADGFSRAVTAAEVVDPAARELNLAPGYVADRVSATPVTRTAVLTINGSGADEREAVAITNAIAQSLRRYADVTQSDPVGRDDLVARYRRAYRRQVEAEQEVSRLRRNGATDAEIVDARAAAEFRRVSATTAREALEADDAQKATGAVLNPLTPAREAYSDRSSKLQLFGLVGILAGGLVGAGLAVLNALKSGRRRRRRVAA